MLRRLFLAASLLWFAAVTGAIAQNSGWTLPPAAADEKNPVAVTQAPLASGRWLFREHCQRCHGPQGKGNGTDADSKIKQTMDLTSDEGPDENLVGPVSHRI